MKYGHFDDKAREYVIDTPRTPYRGLTISAANSSLASQQYRRRLLLYRDARLRRVTRYRYNNMPVDNGGRYFYIKDGDTVWNPGWKPSKRSWTAIPAATAWATPSSPVRRTV